MAQRWRRFRAWRRISFTRSGLAFSGGALAVGFAAINTGNNLLYLLLGAMLGLVAVSGWLSEQVIRGVRVERRVPRGLPAGREGRITYRVVNRKKRLPSLALDVQDDAVGTHLFLARVEAGATAVADVPIRFDERGVRRLRTVTVSTGFPFGFFRKSRDLELPGELVVWPRTNHPLQPPVAGAGPRGPGTRAWRLPTGPRGEYRGLREYRVGDDPRDIHWRTTARRDRPIVREYDREAARTLWVCLDPGAEPGEDGETAVEIAASLAARAVGEGRRFGLVAGERILPPGTGPGHLHAVLDALARVELDPAAPAPAPPAEPEVCVLVSVSGRGRDRFGDALVVSALPRGTGSSSRRAGSPSPAEVAGVAAGAGPPLSAAATGRPPGEAGAP